VEINMTATSASPETSAALRDELVSALEADLIGPFDPELHEELLPLPPSRYYLCGFLAPEQAREQHDPEEDAELEGGDDLPTEDNPGQEPQPKQRRRFPASLGMSVLLPAEADEITATVRYADYLPEQGESASPGRKPTHWRRMLREAQTLTLPLEPKAIAKGLELPHSGGVWVRGMLRPSGANDQSRALSLFVVNERAADEARQVGRAPADDAFIFQVEFALRCEQGFLPRPNRRGADSHDLDERTADLQFRDKVEYAVGHGVSVTMPATQCEPGQVCEVRTCWLPRYEVKRVTTHTEEAVETSMEALAAATDGPALRNALAALPERYGAWIESQAAIPLDDPRREETRTILVAKAQQARARIHAGIERLAADDEARRAFCLANHAMATAARQRNPERYETGGVPSWRLFQLAFVLLNINGVADERSDDREIAELVFFPTGGGKTEAYLGVIGFCLLLRRMRGVDRPDRGLGVTVLLRYTLRLLTLDQLGRAATLICALELLRQEQPELLGDVRFSVGLWVGGTATPNTMEQARKQVTDYKNSKSTNARSPLPLPECPWCSTPLDRDSLALFPSKAPTEVRVSCGNFRDPCPFNARQNSEGLPVLFVDEQIYRELPCFVVGTVDKFAMLPWRGETAKLFGRVASYRGRQCFGALDGPTAQKGAQKLPEGFRPPELVVQDELHLISGPLGTMVGLYETAIDYLCQRDVDGHAVRPKLIASTATVRRAGEQVRALFDRAQLAMFPPAGVDDSETYFAKVDHDVPGRLYVGVAAAGRSMKGILLRGYVSSLAAAQRHFDPQGPERQPADPYMTVVGYFNSLRELGGMRRLVEDEVRSRVGRIEDRRPLDWEGTHRWYRSRELRTEPVELTSRESTAKVSEAKARLGREAIEESPVDVLLASNMISVGVDIDRLGLMIIAGQPKTTAEYIQASSRVGRDAKRPGLVLTCFNLHRPRDRSHYERFAAYHQSFYRDVEATSVTPFSGPALDRGLAGVLVAMTRLRHDVLTPPKAAGLIEQHVALGEAVVEALAQRAAIHDAAGDELAAAIRARARNLLESWRLIMREAVQEAGAPDRTYSRFDLDRGSRPLLYTWGDREDYQGDAHGLKFRAPTSMRDVEESVHLWLERRQLGGRGGGYAKA
jgi:hypothetical protein